MMEPLTIMTPFNILKNNNIQPLGGEGFSAFFIEERGEIGK